MKQYTDSVRGMTLETYKVIRKEEDEFSNILYHTVRNHFEKVRGGQMQHLFRGGACQEKTGGRKTTATLQIDCSHGAKGAQEGFHERTNQRPRPLPGSLEASDLPL